MICRSDGFEPILDGSVQTEVVHRQGVPHPSLGDRRILLFNAFFCAARFDKRQVFGV